VSSTPSAVAHQFDDAEQQSQAVTLGMWVFLVTEIMFFGGLFAGYTLYRVSYPGAFVSASHHLDVKLGGVNTAILIGSSLTMALAVYAATKAKKGALGLFIVLTMSLGLSFLGIKAIEYGHKFEEHLVPGAMFDRALPDSDHQQLFFSFYFAMTGLHAAHMIIGIAVMVVILTQVVRSDAPGRFAARMEVMGLYWHFVDIVWIFLFPLLYLIGRHA
jgi:cytochrome c oxidase subunit III